MYRYAIVAVLAVVLCATHWKAYVVGKTTVMSQWQQEKLQMSQKALEAEQESRQKEQQLVAAKEKAEKQYVDEKRKAAKSAASASAELDRLRDALATAPTDSGKENHCACTGTRVDVATGLERELLGHCATSLVQLAAEADRLETVVVGLQRYVKDVCLAQ